MAAIHGTITRKDLQDEFRQFLMALKHELEKEFHKLNERMETLELSFAVPRNTAWPKSHSNQRLLSPPGHTHPPQPPKAWDANGIALPAAPDISETDVIGVEEFDAKPMDRVRTENRLQIPGETFPLRPKSVENGHATSATFQIHGHCLKPGPLQVRPRSAQEADVVDVSDNHLAAGETLSLSENRKHNMRSHTMAAFSNNPQRSSDAKNDDWTLHHPRTFKTGQEARFWTEVNPTGVDASRSKVAKKMSRTYSAVESFRSSLDRKVGISDTSEDAKGEQTESKVVISDPKPSCQGYALKLISSGYFSGTIAFCIFTNALTIGLQADVMGRERLSETPFVFRVIELIFCAVFTLEIVVKLAALHCKYFWMPGWTWNIFDFTLVTMQLTEELLQALMDGQAFVNLSAMRVLRILRVVRIIRVIRLLRMISELRAIIASVIGSLRALGWTVLLLISFMYILSVYLTQLTVEMRISQGSDDDIEAIVRLYGSLGISMLTLYQSIAGGIDWDDAVRPLMDQVHAVFGLFFSLYIAFTLLAIMNVVTGVFVESALSSAREDKDIYMVNHIRGLIDSMTTENNGSISWEDFQTHCDSADMAEVFKTIDVDIKEAGGLFRLLDLNGNGEVDSEEFLDGCLRLRGPAKALDMALLMREIRHIRTAQEELSMDLQGMVDDGELPQPQGSLLRNAKNSVLRTSAMTNEDPNRGQRRASDLSTYTTLSITEF